MKTMLAIFLVLCAAAMADSVLIMQETTSDITRSGMRVIDVAKDKDDALKKITAYSDSTNFFKGVPFVAVLHTCNHVGKNQSCKEEVLSTVKEGKNTDMSKNVIMTSTEANPYRKLVDEFRLPVKDKADATAKEAAVRVTVTNKTFTVTEKLTTEAPK